MKTVVSPLNSTPAQKYHPDRQFPFREDWLELFVAKYGLQASHITEIPHGVENTSFRVTTDDGQYILRIYRQHKKTSTEIRREIDFAQFLNKSGIPTPTLLKNTSGKRLTELRFDGVIWQAILMVKIPGSTLT